MPFCNLPETEVVNTLKHAFTKNKTLPARKELKYFYDQLPAMDTSCIEKICDKTVLFGKVDFTVRISGSKENADPGKPTRLEELRTFSVYACNDELFAAANADRYLYAPSIGETTFDAVSAKALAEKAAAERYANYFLGRGYSYDGCTVEAWTYAARGVENYTEYTFRYDCMGKQADNIKGVGYGDKMIVCNEPIVPDGPAPEAPAEPPKRAKWPYILGGIVVVAVIVAAVSLIIALS